MTVCPDYVLYSILTQHHQCHEVASVVHLQVSLVVVLEHRAGGGGSLGGTSVAVLALASYVDRSNQLEGPQPAAENIKARADTVTVSHYK